MQVIDQHFTRRILYDKVDVLGTISPALRNSSIGFLSLGTSVISGDIIKGFREKDLNLHHENITI